MTWPEEVETLALLERINQIGALSVYQYEAGRPYKISITILKPNKTEIKAQGDQNENFFLALRSAYREALKYEKIE